MTRRIEAVVKEVREGGHIVVSMDGKLVDMFAPPKITGIDWPPAPGDKFLYIEPVDDEKSEPRMDAYIGYVVSSFPQEHRVSVRVEGGDMIYEHVPVIKSHFDTWFPSPSDPVIIVQSSDRGLYAARCSNPPPDFRQVASAIRDMTAIISRVADDWRRGRVGGK